MGRGLQRSKRRTSLPSLSHVNIQTLQSLLPPWQSHGFHQDTDTFMDRFWSKRVQYTDSPPLPQLLSAPAAMLVCVGDSGAPPPPLVPSAPVAKHWFALESEPSEGFQAVTSVPEDPGDRRQSHKALWSQLVAIQMSPHTVLEPLWATGLLIYKCLPHVPRVSGFWWEMLVCTVMVLFLVRSGLSLRRRKGQCSQNEVSGKGMEMTEPDAQACGAVASSEQKASPLPLQILALAVLNQDAGYFSMENAEQLLKGVGDRLLKSPQQLPGENPISGSAQEGGEPLARKIAGGFKDSPGPQGSAEPGVQDIGSCGQRVQEEAGEAGGPSFLI
ncbi:uncharacterized protein LOC122904536 [Neovison vison]|uniref:uncharacterized protein LOC122904536 n=1 Tax=Neovison vison TaxID=452646 RepID=UPI001CEFE2F4|nr:uncharacterized protein LOC122904536 [Neogale vison]XP_044101426.1 uncharacterized protein LOC122904536 [Neogale vison]XP_044101427.1 uncharacterized protein LOC122904536 [Neogale vison]XP_044101428.1 uncharacterized protein LOC122904536 [Neogale vison]